MSKVLVLVADDRNGWPSTLADTDISVVQARTADEARTLFGNGEDFIAAVVHGDGELVRHVRKTAGDHVCIIGTVESRETLTNCGCNVFRARDEVLSLLERLFCH